MSNFAGDRRWTASVFQSHVRFVEVIFTMRKIVIAACVLGFLSSQAWAQNCKPDLVYTDKLSKEKADVWQQVLSSKGGGILGGLTSTSAVTIYASFGRLGSKNVIQVTIQKSEESAVKAVARLDSALRGAVGKPFYFGFKNGDPVEFKVTGVINNARVAGVITAKAVTTTDMEAAVSDKALAALRETLVSRQIDVVRIALSDDVRIEASVDDKTGKKMMEKFSCFYQSLDKKGIDLSAAVDPPSQPSPSASASESKSQKPASQLTIDQIIQMVAAKLPDDIIITTIRNSSSKFELTPEALIKLKTAGVSDAVIRAMGQ